jgi:hypothetical protein
MATTIELGLFFDYNEYYVKEEGFYPQLSIPKNIQFSKLHIKFILKNEMWCQTSGPAIAGFYENTGEEILRKLNELGNISAIQIMNYGGRIIHPTEYQNATFKIITKKRCFSF